MRLKHKIIGFLSLISTLVTLFASHPQTVSAAVVHPGLYYTAQELVNLRALETAPSHSDIWQGLKSWADANISSPAPTAISSNWNDATAVKQYLDNMCFMYAMTGDSKYANAAKNWALAVAGIANWGQGDFDSAGIAAAGMAVAYDGLYGFLSATDRTTLQNAIVANVGALYTNWGNASDYSQYPNGLNIVGAGVGLSALALEGDYSGAAGWLNMAVTFAQTSLATGGSDGGWFEGLTYGTTLEYMIQFLDALKRLKGTNLFAGSSFLKQLPYFYIYGSHQNGGVPQMLPIEDTPYPAGWAFRGNYFLYRLASEYGDGRAQWYGDQASAAMLSAISYYPKSAVSMFTWKSPTLTAIPPTDLPLTRYFPSIGYVFVRTSWDATANILVFKSGTSVGHAHADQNSWSLYGPSGVITGNPGYISGTQYDLTASANSILANGLGQAQEPGDFGSASLGTRGVIQQVDTPPSYAYVRADGQAPYINRANADPRLASGNLSQWLRSMVVMKSPFYFVIMDNVAAPQPTQFDWLLQGDGGTLTASGNTIGLSNGINLNAVISEPQSFTAQLVGASTNIQYPQMRIRPSSNVSATNFLATIFPGSQLSTSKVKQGNLLGVAVAVDATHKDLILFSADGQPVNQWVELGGQFAANDGQSYSFNGTQVLANFSNYAVIRLVAASGAPPALTTNPASGITANGATLNATLSSLGSSSSVALSFEYGPTASYGTTVTAVPASSTAPGNFSFSAGGLAPNTLYHFRAKAVGPATVWGSDQTFTTLPTFAVTTNSLPNARVGAAYSQALAVAGGSAPYSWAVTAGALPAGLTLGSNGVISGVTTAAVGTYPVTLRVTDSLGASAAKALSLVVSGVWDVNADGVVNVLDLNVVVQRMGETGSAGWISQDVNSDGVINILDVILVGQHFS